MNNLSKEEPNQVGEKPDYQKERQAFIDFYTNRRETQNMTDALGAMFDMWVAPLGGKIKELEQDNNTQSKVRKHYACRLDEQQCGETCHGNRELKEVCEFCTVTEIGQSKVVGEKEEQRFTIEDMREAYLSGYDRCAWEEGLFKSVNEQPTFNEWIKTRKQ